MKKIFYILLTTLLLTSCTQISRSNSVSLKNEKTQVIGNIITCKLVISTNISENGDELVAESNIDKNPLELIFSGLDKDNVKMKGNFGEVELEKIETTNQIYLFEETGAGNIVIYTLFRNSGVLIMSKQYNLGGAFGLQMIGNCK